MTLISWVGDRFLSLSSMLPSKTACVQTSDSVWSLTVFKAMPEIFRPDCLLARRCWEIKPFPVRVRYAPAETFELEWLAAG